MKNNKFEIDQQEPIIRDHGFIILYKRADRVKPVWQARIKLERDTGYVIRSTGRENLDEARQVAINIYDGVIKNFLVTGNKKIRTYEQVANEWLQIIKYSYSPSTIKEFNRQLQPAIKFWSGKPFSSFTQADLQDYLNDRLHGGNHPRKANTVKRSLVPLRHVFKFAYSKKYCDKHLSFEKINTEYNRRPFFTGEEWEKIVQNLSDWAAQVKEHPAHYRSRTYLKYYVLIVGETGMRPGTEANKLRWSNLKTKQIKNKGKPLELLIIDIYSGKVGDRRTTVAPKVKHYFNELKKIRKDELKKSQKEFNDNEYIFCHTNGHPIRCFSTSFRSFLVHHNLLKDEKGNCRVPYSLRHTYATRHIGNKKVSPWDLAKNMGTSLEQLRKHYVQDDVESFGKYSADLDVFEEYATLDKFEIQPN